MDERTILLIGKDSYNKIKNTHVLLVGVGGVGGYAMEALIRSGIENITIVDYDTITTSNINRQIIALNNNVGMTKTNEAEKRIKSINDKVKVNKINEKISEDNIKLLFSEDYDYIIDACDTLIVKKLLLKECEKRKIKLITVCGMGKKLDPSKVKICKLSSTSYDPLAKALRKYAKDEKLRGKLMCVASDEKPKDTDSKIIPSMILVPSTAGIIAASYVINDIIKENN